MASPPRDNITLVPLASFRAFYQNFAGIQRTSEMRLSIVVPTEDIMEAMKVTEARDEILYLQVSKMRYDETGLAELGEQIAQQQRELGINNHKPLDELAWDQGEA